MYQVFHKLAEKRYYSFNEKSKTELGFITFYFGDYAINEAWSYCRYSFQQVCVTNST